MNYLLPNKLKRIGLVITPLGIVLWTALQLNYLSQPLAYITPANSNIGRIVLTILSFFTFLLGLYFIAFAKEKVEDEMVQRTRLDSFQFAAIVQMFFVIAGFVGILAYKDPGAEGMMLFFIAAVCLFWVCFISRFNYVLHIKIKE